MGLILYFHFPIQAEFLYYFKEFCEIYAVAVKKNKEKSPGICKKEKSMLN